MRNVCVFCGSNPGLGEVYLDAARSLGKVLVKRSLGLVYGGACVGMMGTLADTVLDAGGSVVGVMPAGLIRMEVAHRGLTQFHEVTSMHERKAMMAELSGGFIAMPGGFGTLDEFCEILTWAQLGLHEKPCGLLNVAGYWDKFLDFLDHGVSQQLLKAGHRNMILADTDAERLLDRMTEYKPVHLSKLASRQRT